MCTSVTHFTWRALEPIAALALQAFYAVISGRLTSVVKFKILSIPSHCCTLLEVPNIVFFPVALLGVQACCLFGLEGALWKIDKIYCQKCTYTFYKHNYKCTVGVKQLSQLQNRSFVFHIGVFISRKSPFATPSESDSRCSWMLTTLLLPCRYYT